MPEESGTSGVWNITTTELGAVDELVPFSHSVTYTDPLYPSVFVSLQAVEENPSTVYISGNNITGYYQGSFNISVLYKNTKDQFVTVTNFKDIKTEELHEVISYSPSSEPLKIYNYIATATDPNGVVLSTMAYTKTVNNNWDINRKLLVQYVKNTVVQDANLLVNWINSINASKVGWRNSSNIVISWAYTPTEE